VRSNYISTICSRCNIRICYKSKLFTFFHNASRYDYAHIIRYAKRTVSSHFKVLGRNTQQFMKVTINRRIEIIDSFKHLPSSLAALVTTLLKDGVEKFQITKNMPPFNSLSDEILKKHIIRKQPYPYSYMQNPSSYDLDRVPDIDWFYDDLKDVPCTPEDYEQVKTLFTLLNCRNLRDLTKYYLLLDTGI